MKKIVYILISLVLLASCQKPEADSDQSDTKVLPGYKELLEAYDAGKQYKAVEASAGQNVVVFEDGSKITIPESSFPIHDHTASPAPTVEFIAMVEN